jgi:hypothetical protein
MKKWGKKSILTLSQEQVLFERVMHLCSRGFPLTIDKFRQTAYHFAKVLHRRKMLETLPETWTRDKTASYEWWYSYKERFPQLALRVAENLSSSRAEAFNKHRVTSFYEEASQVLNNAGVSSSPHLIYNCDETGLSSVPNKSRKVLAEKGKRIIQQIQTGERGTLTTFLPCCNANGEYIPPFLIFKGQHIPQSSDYPPNTRLMASRSGYIDMDIFLSFLQHFECHRNHEIGKKAILFLDGHKSHVSAQAVEYCSQVGIELVCLPPHSTHRLQPLDTHFNKGLKSKWSANLAEFLRNNSKVQLCRQEFYKVFNPTWAACTERRSLLVDAFQYCGLFPCRDPTTNNDFQMALNFVTDTRQSSTLHESHDLPAQTAIRIIAPSPRKTPNPVHLKQHIAHITSPTMMMKLSQRNNSHSSSSGGSGQAPQSSFNEANAESPMHGSAQGHLRTLPQNVPSTSSGVNHGSHGYLPQPPKKRAKRCIPSQHHSKKTKQVSVKESRTSNNCVVCDEEYSNSSLDWFCCPGCHNWTCEMCFASDLCYNCSD